MRGALFGLVAIALVDATAHAQAFPGDILVHFGGKAAAVHVSSCEDWRSKLAGKATNATWVYDYRVEQPEKSEYETTEHYRQRTARPPAYASISLDGPFESAKYDADTGTLTIDYAGDGGLVFDHQQNTGAYIGANAFGASRRVTRNKEVALFATIADNKTFEPSHLVLNVSPARARAIKEHGHLRILGEIVDSDWARLLNFATQPTIDDPEEWVMETRDVTIRPLCSAVEVDGIVTEWTDLK